MQLKQGVTVNTADGQDLGRLERVVIDPQTRAITHVVVHKGLLVTHAKVIPFDLIASAGDEGVVLKLKAAELPDLPDFQEKHFVMASDEEWGQSPLWAGKSSPLLWYPPIENTAGGHAPNEQGMTFSDEIDLNIPGSTIPLKGGAQVLSADDKHVGDVEWVVTTDGSDHVTHLVIANGVLFKDKRLIPVKWIRTIDEGTVHLAVGARLLSTLPAYGE